MGLPRQQVPQHLPTPLSVPMTLWIVAASGAAVSSSSRLSPSRSQTLSEPPRAPHQLHIVWPQGGLLNE